MNSRSERERGLTEVDFAEGSTSDLAAELVLAANDAFHVEEGSRNESEYDLGIGVVAACPSEEKPKPHSR